MSFFNWFRKKQVESDGEVLSKNELLNKFIDVWPDVYTGSLWLADENYVMPTKDDLEKALFLSEVSSYQYVPEIEDCDDFALLLQADIIRNRYDNYKAGKIPENLQYPWAFGQIWYQSSQGHHAVNICITCDEGILMIEPQTDKIWKPDSSIHVSFIRI